VKKQTQTILGFRYVCFLEIQWSRVNM